MSDDVALEFQILGSLSDRPRARNGKSCLHAGQAAEPGKLHLVVDKGSDCSGVALDRQIFDWNAQLGLEILGVLGKSLNEPRFIFVRNCREHQRRLLGVRNAGRQHAQRDSENRSL